MKSFNLIYLWIFSMNFLFTTRIKKVQSPLMKFLNLQKKKLINLQLHIKKYFIPYKEILISLIFFIIHIINIFLLQFSDKYFNFFKLIFNININLIKQQQFSQIIYIFNKYLLIINILILLNFNLYNKNFNRNIVKKYLFIYKFLILFLCLTYIFPNNIIYHRYFFKKIYHIYTIILTILMYLSILLILNNQYKINILEFF